MIGPIYTGAEARALRERLADTATSHTRTVTLTSAELAALDAVPRLTASVGVVGATRVGAGSSPKV